MTLMRETRGLLVLESLLNCADHELVLSFSDCCFFILSSSLFLNPYKLFNPHFLTFDPHLFNPNAHLFNL